ncbi:unnamed protein product [Bursaphelenchus okinawaensis]|uniref:Acyl-CoA thioesterase II n=1 Tax=Bursaphelenchus okinawaensis TaxID=465554 RepID=A0A811KB66_9BILA|nr:unnamed protein product [Bursaphelenchus okinawaensis]CAG9096863.1 unnamed protein product [Bursaphelenchus okinawaensis]
MKKFIQNMTRTDVKYQNSWDRLTKVNDSVYKSKDGHNDPNIGHNMIFGGSLLANAVHCSYESVPKDCNLSNLHSYFVRAGNGDEPTEFEVKNIRDGRNFVFREVNATQHDKLIFSAQMTFRKFPNKTLLTQIKMPEASEPSSLKTSVELLQDYIKTNPEKRLLAGATMRISIPFIELRPVNGSGYLIGPEKATRTQLLWARWNGTPVKSTERFAVTALSSMSDYGLSIAGAQFFYNVPFKVMTSLDQNVWIHRTDFDVTDYILLEQNADWHSDNNSFVQGRLWSRQGVLLASFTQNVVVEPIFEHSKL